MDKKLLQDSVVNSLPCLDQAYLGNIRDRDEDTDGVLT